MKMVRIEYTDYAGHPWREKFMTTRSYPPKEAKQVIENLFTLGCRDMRMVPADSDEVKQQERIYGVS